MSKTKEKLEYVVTKIRQENVSCRMWPRVLNAAQMLIKFEQNGANWI